MMDPLMALVNRVNAPTTDRHTAAPKRRFPASPARNQRRKPPTPASPRTSTLDHLAGLVGNDGAARLVAAYGGTRIYIPQEPLVADALCQLLGHDALCKLAAIYGGDRIEIPNPPPRRLRILELRASGLSIDAIARSLHCTRRRVFQVMAEARATPSTPAPLKTRTVRHPPAR